MKAAILHKVALEIIHHRLPRNLLVDVVIKFQVEETWLVHLERSRLASHCQKSMWDRVYISVAIFGKDKLPYIA